MKTKPNLHGLTRQQLIELVEERDAEIEQMGNIKELIISSTVVIVMFLWGFFLLSKI